jgi:purine-binding chemotaxis protein CheW
VLTVTAGDRWFGIPLGSVREIVRDLRLVPLAGAPDRVVGLAGYRGEPLAVVALAVLAGADVTTGAPGPVVVIDLGDEGSVGLAVDDVTGVRRVEPDTTDGTRGAFTRVATDAGGIEVLDIDGLRTSARPGEV